MLWNEASEQRSGAMLSFGSTSLSIADKSGKFPVYIEGTPSAPVRVTFAPNNQNIKIDPSEIVFTSGRKQNF